MNNLLSYCGLVEAKIRASDKDLPVPSAKLDLNPFIGYFQEYGIHLNTDFRLIQSTLNKFKK